MYGTRSATAASGDHLPHSCSGGREEYVAGLADEDRKRQAADRDTVVAVGRARGDRPSAGRAGGW